MSFQKILSSLRCSKMAMLIRRPYRKIFRKLEDAGITPDHPLWFLRKSRGIIHVGANVGQEAWIYALMGKSACWFEPIPDVFSRLNSNISQFRGQSAYQELVTDKDGETYVFKIANNDGESSSIFDLDQHKAMYPDVAYVDSITLISRTLDTCCESYRIPCSFDALIMDTQGSELLILKGASNTLRNINWIYLECADFSSYSGGCTCLEISEHLASHGFHEALRYPKKHDSEVGSYFDILYTRV